MDDTGERKVDSDTSSKQTFANLAEDSLSTGLPIDERREKKLIRKIDLHILPFVVLLYLFSFLDRGMRSGRAEEVVVQSS